MAKTKAAGNTAGPAHKGTQRMMHNKPIHPGKGKSSGKKGAK